MPSKREVTVGACTVVLALATGASVLAQRSGLPAPTPVPPGPAVTPPVTPAPATPAGTLALVAPESIVIPAHGGRGSAVVWLSWKGKGASPTLIATEAAGPANIVPATAIAVTPISGGEKRGDNEILFSVSIAVDAPREIRPGTEYTASLVSPGVSPLRFRIKDVTTESIAFSPQTITFAWRLFQSGCVPLQVTNTGNTDVSHLSASVWAQSAVGLQVQGAGAMSPPLASPIVPAHHASVDICPPLPALAGTYSGTVQLAYNGTKSEKVPMSMTARGPTFGYRALLGLPFVLFAALVALGFRISTLLEQWFTLGGLARAEAAIALVQLSGQLEALRARLAAIGNMPRALTRIDVLRNIVESIRSGGLVAGQPGDWVSRISCAVQGAQWAATALEALAPAARPAALAAVDALVLPEDQTALTQYRAAVLAATTPPGVALTAPAQADRPEVFDPEQLSRKIARMALLQRVLVWAVTGFTAYVTFYVNNAAFGSSLDYIGVFVWALGLTQAGTQMLALAKWPARP